MESLSKEEPLRLRSLAGPHGYPQGSRLRVAPRKEKPRRGLTGIPYAARSGRSPGPGRPWRHARRPARRIPVLIPVAPTRPGLLVRGRPPVGTVHSAEVVGTFTPEDLGRASASARRRLNTRREQQDRQSDHRKSQVVHITPLAPDRILVAGSDGRSVLAAKDVISRPLLSRAAEETRATKSLDFPVPLW